MLYLDTSALVKKYHVEPGTEAVRELLRSDQIVASSLFTLAEAETTLGRLFRERELDEQDLYRLRRELVLDWHNFHVVDLSDRIIEGVRGLAVRLPLRTGDAIHLASALFLSLPEEPLVFCSADASLLRSAAAEGLRTWSPLAS